MDTQPEVQSSQQTKNQKKNNANDGVDVMVEDDDQAFGGLARAPNADTEENKDADNMEFGGEPSQQQEPEHKPPR